VVPVGFDPQLIRESWALAGPVADKIAAQFYGMIFSRHPQVRQMFPVAMDAQRDRLLKALTQTIVNLDDPETMAAQLRDLARDHRKYGVRPEHYPIVGRCLLAALRANLADDWKTEYDEAWSAAYEAIANIMIEAAEEDTSLAYWTARIVANELRTPDIAVITVEPSQRYPFRAGQHATVQTSRWPKVWRPYSIANAPRADNRLTFHVRVVPGGWVSTSLVRHSRIGDELLLGPARGNLVLPPTPPQRLICAAGGTGLAPLKAIIEDTGRTGTIPEVTLVHGVRQRTDLYDLPDLQVLAARHGRVRLITAISDDPGYARQETTADAIGHLDLGGDPDCYICGPTQMIEATEQRLTSLGTPRHRLHRESDMEANIPLVK
jgi:ferredoxin-NADP reductase/hemoglobin-like flavoprotein